MKELTNSPIFWISIGFVTPLIIVILLTMIKRRRRMHFKNPPLNTEDIDFINRNSQPDPENERKLNNLLTKEDEDLIKKYYEGNPNLKT